MKIYTKKGDTGQTSLLGGKRVDKDDLRLEAYGTIDELNAYMGLLSDQEALLPINTFIRKIQEELFTIGAILAADPTKPGLKLPKPNPQRVGELEQSIDQMETQLPPLKNFVMPGGHEGGSIAHVARCVCRRAERRVVALSREEDVEHQILIYLNRLSDWLFVCSRHIMYKTQSQEVLWIPEKS